MIESKSRSGSVAVGVLKALYLLNAVRGLGSLPVPTVRSRPEAAIPEDPHRR